MTAYPTDLTPAEADIVAEIIPWPDHLNRIHTLAAILNAIYYVLRGGISWRLMPGDLPRWGTAYHYFRQWRLDGTWERLNTELRERGYDGHKKVNGRKRAIVVDTLGLVMNVKVVPANTKETDAAQNVLEGMGEVFPSVKLVWADQGFMGWVFGAWVLGALKWELRISKGVGKPGQEGFRVAPRRWVVERTFAWLGRYRRMAKDYERLAETSECVVLACMTRLMLARLTRAVA